MKLIVNYLGKKRFNMFDLVMILIGLFIFIAFTFWYWVGFTVIASVFQIILDHYYDKQILEDELDEEELEKEWHARFDKD